MNRISLNSESAKQMHTREIVFEPFDALIQREAGTEPILLRARKELLEPDAKWCVLLGSCPNDSLTPYCYIPWLVQGALLLLEA